MVHKNKCLEGVENDENIKIMNSAFKSRMINYRISDEPLEHVEIDDFLKTVKNKIFNLLDIGIEKHKALKVNFELFSLYTKYVEKNEENLIKSFNTKYRIINSGTDKSKMLEDVLQYLQVRSRCFKKNKSGWVAQKVLYLDLNINKFQPMRGLYHHTSSF